MNIEEKKQLLKGLISQAPTAPVQKIKQVKSKGWHFNAWLPDELGTKLKVHSAVSKKSAKDIVIEALELYLSEGSNGT